MARHDLIFRILSVVRSIEARTGLDQLDLSARAILRFVAERNFDGHSTRSSDVVQLCGLGTAPTVYSRLSELEEAGWIKSAHDPEDGRVKRLTLTPRAEKAFKQMSRELARLIPKTSRAAD